MIIASASPHHAGAVADLFSQAFRADPVWAIYDTKGQGRQEYMSDHYRQEVLRHPERTDVALTEDGSVIGALIWEPPQHQHGGGRVGVLNVPQFLGTLVKRSLGEKHDRLVDSYRPVERHWYIHDVASASQARGQGVGTGLLRHRLTVIDRENSAPVFLESTTPGSRKLYSRLGFQLIAELPTVPGSSVMVRPGHSATANTVESEDIE